MTKSKNTRKDKVFSVSMREGEIIDIEDHLKELEAQSGYSVSRNELIRKVTLAHIEFMKLKGTKNEKDYFEIFKGIKK